MASNGGVKCTGRRKNSFEDGWDKVAVRNLEGRLSADPPLDARFRRPRK